MTDRISPDEPTDDELAALDELLGDASLWSEADPGDEEAIVAAILAEASAADSGNLDAAPHVDVTPEAEIEATVIPLRRRSWGTAVLSAAAGIVVALLGVAALTALADREAGEVALSLDGTENAPDASAVARIVALDAGTRIELDVSGLPPAPPGSYYEAWLRESPEVGVSAGTFHMRGGDDSIELWAGVVLDDYPLVTVTIQDEAEPESSGVVVLKALFEDG